ncbi:MAG TPA: hypothetical protein VJS11_07100 [Acidobacteriaceae bacterium]|nr:hypothetical protein [Acidobacteriaceae bacterium]
MPLRANDAQVLFEQKARRRNIVLKARQMGMTTWIAGRFFLKTITHPGTVTVQVAHSQEAAEQIFRIVHRFLWQLPEEYREGVLKARASSRRIIFPALDSEYLVETAGDTNAGRGLTITNLHCTELARWRGPAEETLYGLKATLSPASEVTMESTPNGAGGCFWKEWQEAEKTDTEQHFFPWWLEKAYTVEGATVPEESLDEAERELMEKHRLTAGQIAYRRNLRAGFRKLAKQEYAEDANECFLASGECVFERDVIEERLKEVPPPILSRRNGALRIWLPPQPDRRYVVAVDPAGGGINGDYTAIQVVDLDTGAQCAELEEHLPVLETAREAAALAAEYRNALLVVERNNHGSGVLAHLQGACRYEPRYRDGQGVEGALTDSESRSEMIGQLGDALVGRTRSFNSDRLLLQCRNFVRDAKGKAQARAGEHDDCVMAMAIAVRVRNELALGGKRARGVQ